MFKWNKVKSRCDSIIDMTIAYVPYPWRERQCISRRCFHYVYNEHTQARTRATAQSYVIYILVN